MALIDTGLGWSADEDWLKYADGQIGEISSGFTDTLPISPVYDKTESVLAMQLLRTGTTQFDFYACATTPSTLAGYYSSGRLAVYGFSTSSTGHVYFHRYQGNTDMGEYGRDTNNSSASYPGMYYTSQLIIQASNETLEYFPFPTYASQSEMYAGVYAQLSSDPVYKLNEGYAVACFIRWLGVNNTIHTDAILVSSVAENTVLSLDNATPATSMDITRTYQGLAFTMRDLSYAGAGVSVASHTVQYRDITSLGSFSLLSEIFEQVARMASITVTGAGEPYQDDPTEPGGGPTEPDDSEDIPFAIPPYISASSSGFVRLFNPTLSEINSLASFMWSTGFDLDTVKRVYANPIDYIIGASIVPVIPSIKTASYPISFPGLAGSISSGVSMDEVYQYATVSCGSIFISPKWNSYLDYSPYHRFQIWLPYIGFRDIDADDIMNRTIELQYLVDLLSGACNAELLCGGSVLYSWQGQCGAQIPINSADWSSMLTGAISLAASAVKLGASIATGGATASSLVTDVASAGASAFNLKPSISRGGTVAGAAGFMAQQTPYIVRTRPELALPDMQSHFIGYPSFTTVTLGDISGYAEVYSIHLHGVPATEAELTEIEQILKGGVIY